MHAGGKIEALGAGRWANPRNNANIDNNQPAIGTGVGTGFMNTGTANSTLSLNTGNNTANTGNMNSTESNVMVTVETVCIIDVRDNNSVNINNSTDLLNVDMKADGSNAATSIYTGDKNLNSSINISSNNFSTNANSTLLTSSSFDLSSLKLQTSNARNKNGFQPMDLIDRDRSPIKSVPNKTIANSLKYLQGVGSSKMLNKASSANTLAAAVYDENSDKKGKLKVFEIISFNSYIINLSFNCYIYCIYHVIANSRSSS